MSGGCCLSRLLPQGPELAIQRFERGSCSFFFLYFFLKWGYFFFLMGYFFLTFLLLFPYFRKTGKDRKSLFVFCVPPCVCTTFILVKDRKRSKKERAREKSGGPWGGPWPAWGGP